MTNYYINEQRTMPALSRVVGNNEQLSNEPNLVLSEVEWFKQIAHFNNEQPNNEQFTNEPNFEPIGFARPAQPRRG